jgi:hypothetical protein
VGLETCPALDSQDSKGSARPKTLILRAKLSIPWARELERQLHFDILLPLLSSACLLPSLQYLTHLGTMSGRGKGGKGLGKGGAKRHRKVLRDNIQVRLAMLCNMPTSRRCCSWLYTLLSPCVSGLLWPAAAVMHAALLSRTCICRQHN